MNYCWYVYCVYIYTVIRGGMAKRIADKELTDRNWDQEEEGEEVSLTSPAPFLLSFAFWIFSAVGSEVTAKGHVRLLMTC